MRCCNKTGIHDTALLASIPFYLKYLPEEGEELATAITTVFSKICLKSQILGLQAGDFVSGLQTKDLQKN